ncbi:hypothetical protein RRG08_055178 [Elysia crispata]|uniref:Uncharacterized protein n=1 Tax=Elysia crispata TaxID=231223 RepID=A0AAE1A4U7_9GAST|nr:hypothetical protein RRG08_055178 [Elysia crispata]
MEALKDAFAKERLDLPSALVDLSAEEEVGAVGRRKVYGRLYSVWRICTGGRGKVVWPQVLREAVRRGLLENTTTSMRHVRL